jgi:hypothetical protein
VLPDSMYEMKPSELARCRDIYVQTATESKVNLLLFDN